MPSSRDVPDPGIKPMSLISPTMADRFFTSTTWEAQMDMYTLLYLKWITNKDLLYRTLLNAMWQPGWEGSLGENGYMHIYG